ncbi:MAG: gliding motility-associated C-terminal domain-containing protein [Sphingobacteriales bacterium JAD_PAG50586_3]|nr:MAG: gliding motility-associated C-terminal domain-containing protein [Sphingobacteriales bacterium JAD_PAG50586_3]
MGNFNNNSNTTYLQVNNIQGWGCAFYIDDVSVVECDTVLHLNIPNVFTPNNDGGNDTFKIENLPDSSSITIYSRWGAIVYQSDNYQNDWDGSNFSDGVYYYILNLPEGKSKKGTVTILRSSN